MSNRSPDSPTLKQISSTFRWVGWFSFWFQLVLLVVSSAILLFASISTRNPAGTSPGTGLGAAFTVGGILVLGFNMYWALMRYVMIGRRLRDADTADPSELSRANRPKKAEAIQTLRTGLMVSLVGILLALLGAEAIVGLLFGKAVNQGFAGFVNVDPGKFIQPIDILVVQASINVILAQFVAIAASLWLLNKMSRQ